MNLSRILKVLGQTNADSKKMVGAVRFELTTF